MDIKENVKLWFARDDDKNIVLINKANSDDNYSCPICGDKVIPKALESDLVTKHFCSY